MSYWVIITHFIGDWILQPRAGAENKTSSLKWMVFHLCIIHVSFSIFALLLDISHINVVFNTLIHGILDKLVWSIFKKARGPFNKEYKYRNLHAKDYWFYFTIGVDQMLHLVVGLWLFT